MKKVLMIDYAFPPLNQRITLKFAKYLRDYGWEPIILSVKSGYVTLDPDPSLLNQLPKEIRVYRTFAFEIPKGFLKLIKNNKWNNKEGKTVNNFVSMIIINLFVKIKEIGKLIFCLDIHIGWFPFAVVKGMSIINNDKINVIYSFASPYTSHLIAYFLKKITKLPWVCYFQDPWVKMNYLQKGSALERLRWCLAKILEGKIINSADKVIGITQHVVDNFKKIHPSKKDRDTRFKVIPNNFDSNDFNNCKAYVNKTRKEFQVLSVGTIYNYTNPQNVLYILRALLNQNPELKGNLKFIFVGENRRDSGFNPSGFEDLKNIVSFIPQVPFEESINYMKAADMLLLVIVPNTGAEDILTGRLVNYLGAGKPILAVVPEGAASDLIKKSKAGFVVHPEDIDGVKRMFLDLYTRWQNNTLSITPDENIIKGFEVKELTKELAEILNCLVKQEKSS